MNTSGVEHVDVLIVGAGDLRHRHLLPPEICNRTRRLRSWRRGATGGTCVGICSAIPGIRSDSRSSYVQLRVQAVGERQEAIASAGAIMDYLREAADGIRHRQMIRLHHRWC